MSLEEKFHNLCLVHIFLIDKLGRFSFHTKIVHDPRVCHYLETRSFWQVQGHWKKKFHNPCSVHIFLMDKLGRFSFHTKIAHDLRACHDLDPRSFGEL